MTYSNRYSFVACNSRYVNYSLNLISAVQPVLDHDWRRRDPLTSPDIDSDGVTDSIWTRV